MIKNVKWAPAQAIIRKAKGGDNWPITWADDDHLYTAFGDGNGFEPHIPEKLSLGIARLEGGPTDFLRIQRSVQADRVNKRGNGKAGLKASGLLMQGGVLFMWVRNAGNSRLAWSHDHARTWEFSQWNFTVQFRLPDLPQ